MFCHSRLGSDLVAWKYVPNACKLPEREHQEQEQERRQGLALEQLDQEPVRERRDPPPEAEGPSQERAEEQNDAE